MKFRIFLLATALLPAAPAFAQDAPPAEQTINTDDDPTVVTGARIRTDIIVLGIGFDQYPEDSGRAVSVVNRQEIERSQLISVSDVLRRVPGVSVTRNGGPGSFTGVRIRGAEAEQTLVLIDGVRVNDPSSPAGTFDFANLLAGAIDRIEVLRGPNSVIWGSQAIGGVVNITSALPTYGLRGRANAEYGYADSLSANAALMAGGEHVRGSVTAGYYRTDGISAAASGTEDDGFRRYGATGRLEIAPTYNLTIDLRGFFSDSRVEQDGFPPPTYALADTLEYQDSRELYGYAGIKLDLFDQRLHNRLSFTAADIDRDNFDPAAGPAPVFFGHGNSERYAYNGDFEANDWLRIALGIEHEDSRFTDGATPASTGVTSVYGAAVLKPAEMLTVNVGLRQDDHEDFGGHTTAAINAAWRPGYDTTIRASYGEGFKAPTLYQLHSFFGDPFLQPETSESYEFGVEQKLFYNQLTLAGTVFYRDTTNQIDFDLGTFTYGNIARTRGKGVELEVRANPVEGLSLAASVTHLKAQNRSPGANFGKDLARRPRDTGSFSADYDFDFGLKIGTTVYVAGDSYDDAGNFNRLDGYAIVALRAAMRVGDQIEVYGRVENLFDDQYQTVRGYNTFGRAAYAGVRLRFD